MFLTRFKKAGDFMVKTGGCFITIKTQNKNKNQNSHQYYLVSMMSTLKNTEKEHTKILSSLPGGGNMGKFSFHFYILQMFPIFSNKNPLCPKSSKCI